METIKSTLKNDIIKVELGVDYDDKTSTVSGDIELDIENQGLFVDMIHSIFDEGNSKVIIDMSHVSYIDSSGLWALFEGHKKANQQNGKMILINTTKDVKRVLDITKISSKMDICDTEDEAIAAMSA